MRFREWFGIQELRKELPMSKPMDRDPIYRRRRFDRQIIDLCVRWYLTYG